MKPIEKIFNWLLGNPYFSAIVSADRLFLKRNASGDVFDEPPLIAIEENRKSAQVVAVGRAVNGLENKPNIRVHAPFNKLEPLFLEFDVSVALFRHAVRDVFRTAWPISPVVVLRLEGRVTELSDSELSVLSRFARDCGLGKVYIFLDGDELPSPHNYSDITLNKKAHAMIKSAR